MALIGPLFALAGRFLGRVLNASLGWATVLLFGRVGDDRQGRLLLVALASLVWVVLVVGVVLPSVGTMVLAFVPVPSFVDETWVRLAMLAGAVLLPLAIGSAAVWLVRPEDRPHGTGLVTAILRGYPFAFVLALTIALLSAVALVRKIRSLARRWADAHVPVVVKPGGYDAVLDRLEQVLDEAGLDTTRHPAPRVLAIPPRILDRVAGRGLGDLVPDRLLVLGGTSVEVLVYPSDVAISGSPRAVAQARAAIARRLADAPAYLTVSATAQQLEDELRSLAGSAMTPGTRAAAFRKVDDRLASLTVPYDEWETLYRERLQVERDLLARAAGMTQGSPGAPGDAATGVGVPGPSERPRGEASRASQLVGLTGMALLAAYAGFLVIARLLPERDR